MSGAFISGKFEKQVGVTHQKQPIQGYAKVDKIPRQLWTATTGQVGLSYIPSQLIRSSYISCLTDVGVNLQSLVRNIGSSIFILDI